MRDLQLSRVLGERPRSVEMLAGGDICDAFRVDLADRRVFVKVRLDAPPGFFSSEAQGLAWLASVGALGVPAVVAATGELLVLEWIDERPSPGPGAAEAFGRGLAELHRAGADAFGASWPGFIGSLEQDNGPYDSWVELFAEARVLPFARVALERGALDLDGFAVIEQVCARLEHVAGPPEPPSRIHGDLWHGNVLWTTASTHLIDPAAHGGHRETDLAMLALFGAPDLERILASYHEVFALADGWQTRLRLHQLHPLLVHAALFGGSYGAHAVEAARRYL